MYASVFLIVNLTSCKKKLEKVKTNYPQNEIVLKKIKNISKVYIDTYLSDNLYLYLSYVFYTKGKLKYEFTESLRKNGIINELFGRVRSIHHENGKTRCENGHPVITGYTITEAIMTSKDKAYVYITLDVIGYINITTYEYIEKPQKQNVYMTFDKEGNRWTILLPLECIPTTKIAVIEFLQRIVHRHLYSSNLDEQIKIEKQIKTLKKKWGIKATSYDLKKERLELYDY